MLMLNCQVLTEKLPQINQSTYLFFVWVEKAKSIWLKLFYWRRYFRRISGVGNFSYIYYLQSYGLSDEQIGSIKTSNHSITPNLDYYGTKTRVKFNGNWFKQYRLH